VVCSPIVQKLDIADIDGRIRHMGLLYTYVDLLESSIPLGTPFLRGCLAVLTYAIAQSPRPRAASAPTVVEFDILSRFRHPCSCMEVFLGARSGVCSSP